MMPPLTEAAAIAEGERLCREWDRHAADIADTIEAIANEFRALARMFPAQAERR